MASAQPRHPARTGLVGDRDSREVLSLGLAGSHVVDPPNLSPAADVLVDSVSRIRAIAAGKLPDAGGWGLVCSSESVTRNWMFRDGNIDQRRWHDALDGIPDRFDKVWLVADPWARICLDVPAVGVFFGAPIRSLRAFATVGPEGVDESSEILIEHLRHGASIDGVTTGYVHYDSVADPYTEVVTTFSQLSSDDFAREVHGYYWAVLLTELHIQALGGMRRLREESPCSRVEDLSTDGRPRALAILTESPLDLNEERVTAWRDFLRPVRRLGFPGPSEWVGQRTTALGRPLWLFEGLPVPALVRGILLSVAPPAGPALDVEWSDSVEQPEQLICWLRPGSGFDPGIHLGLVHAIVRAWYLSGYAGKLYDVEGKLHSCSDVECEAEDDAQRSLMWQFDPGSCDPDAALKVLARALSVVETLTSIEDSPSQTQVLQSLRIS